MMNLDWLYFPVLQMFAFAFVSWRVALMIHPGIRRWRAARDMAWAKALEIARDVFEAELAARKLEFAKSAKNLGESDGESELR